MLPDRTADTPVAMGEHRKCLAEPTEDTTGVPAIVGAGQQPTAYRS
ncbi:hypothetical protein [Streptomyces katrae]|nr:hypothetical protein [Streptomyces katrae]